MYMCILLQKHRLYRCVQCSFAKNGVGKSFLYSVIYVAIDPIVSVCVFLCVSVCHLYSPKEWLDFDETLHRDTICLSSSE